MVFNPASFPPCIFKSNPPIFVIQPFKSISPVKPSDCITFIFVNIDNYEGEGSGLGYTILQCEKYLQSPFIFISKTNPIEQNRPGASHSLSSRGLRRAPWRSRTARAHGSARERMGALRSAWERSGAHGSARERPGAACSQRQCSSSIYIY